MKNLLFTVYILLLALDASAQKYIFFLHGRIVEEMGMENAVSREYGRYEYQNMIRELSKDGNIVLSEARPKNTDADAYAKRITKQIDSLIKRGVPPEDINVIGASKGGYIATRIAKLAKRKNIKYVIIGACIEEQESVYGKILLIHEASDELTMDCNNTEQSNRNITIRISTLNTGKHHGFLYTTKDWIQPAMNWINN